MSQSTDLIRGELSSEALAELREAKRDLEHHGIADRLTELIGAPIRGALKLLPDAAESVLHAAIEKSLKLALDAALKTLGDAPSKSTRPKLLTHKLLAGLSGAAGGALGGAMVAIELPVSTLLILRSVADIARSEGEDLNDVSARLACLEVLALDPGKQAAEPAADVEIGYFAVRAALANQIREASHYVLKNGIADTAAPPLVRLIAQISQRFGLVVSEKLAAQAIPVIGALGGALINSYFIDHYQDLARAHFTVRRLERKYGTAIVRAEYNRLKAE